MFTLPTMAQTPSDSLVGDPEYRYKNLTQLWHNTSNAAGLSLDDSSNRGFASIGLPPPAHDDSRHHDG